MTPAKIRRTSEFSKKVFPKKDADAPSTVKTVENPKQNKTSGKKFIFFDTFEKIQNLTNLEYLDKSQMEKIQKFKNQHLNYFSMLLSFF